LSCRDVGWSSMFAFQASTSAPRVHTQGWPITGSDYLYNSINLQGRKPTAKYWFCSSLWPTTSVFHRPVSLLSQFILTHWTMPTVSSLLILSLHWTYYGRHWSFQSSGKYSTDDLLHSLQAECWAAEKQGQSCADLSTPTCEKRKAGQSGLAHIFTRPGWKLVCWCVGQINASKSCKATNFYLTYPHKAIQPRTGQQPYSSTGRQHIRIWLLLWRLWTTINSGSFDRLRTLAPFIDRFLRLSGTIVTSSGQFLLEFTQSSWTPSLSAILTVHPWMH